MSRGGSIRLLSASALTKVHPGAGRSPGVVDLPVVRDPLGYPFIPGSMVKGSLRTIAERRGNGNSVVCLFGPDVESPEKHAGALAFTDLYPLLVPAASAEHGVVYLTSPYLLARAAALLREAGRSKVAEGLEKLAENAASAPVFTGGSGRISAGSLELENVSQGASPKGLEELYKGLNPLYTVLPPKSRILVVPEDQAVLAIDAQLFRVARIRLDDNTKTVARGGLWTEEYIPWGTLFLGAVLDTGFRGRNCSGIGSPLETLHRILSQGAGPDGFSIIVGGKETVGSGLLRARLV